MNKGCNNCVSYQRASLQMWGPEIPMSCARGNQEALKQWWEGNGHKQDTDTLTEMPCFSFSELAKRTNKLIEALDKLNECIDEKSSTSKI